MFPWLAMGHITPFLHLSNELAARGHSISFLLPKKAQSQLYHLNLHPSLITFHPLTIPPVDGLPAGAETASDIPIFLTNHLATAMDLTRDQLQEFLHTLKPDFIFYDMAHWVPDLASPLGIKTVCYNVISAASIALVPLQKSCENKPLTLEQIVGPPPGYPSSTVVLRGHEYRNYSFMFMEFGSGILFYERVTTAMLRSDAVAIRTCHEIEQGMYEYISTEYSKPVLLTGSVLPKPEETKLEERWGTWLDQFKPGSVVFCALGSQIILEMNQFQELVLGFELTGLPFFAALKPPLGATTIEEALPEGFKERTRVLGHPSVGCFVNHCGFGSMWESLMSDSQIVLVPYLVDQVVNTRLLAAELKVAVEVERDEDGGFTKESLCKSIMCVMDGDSEVGGLVRKNHRKWKETLASPGFMSNYIDEFVHNLHQL
ncbi:hypothetical protein LguiB_002871 [Lonicera macranthoides]